MLIMFPLLHLGTPDSEKKKEIGSRAAHKLSLEEASEKFISNGNPRKMYKILEEAGKGGFGSVVVAKKLDDKKRIAVKRVPHFTKKEKWSNLDEICFLQASAHNCVVKYYNSYISRDELWVKIIFKNYFWLIANTLALQIR